MSAAIIQPPAFQRPSGCLYLGAPQLNIPQGVETIVTLNTIAAYFIDGIEDIVNNRITPGIRGFYNIGASVRWQNVVANKQYRVNVRKNGVATIVSNWLHTALVDDLLMTFSNTVYLLSTDYVQLTVYHADGSGTVDILAGLNSTSLTIQRVR